MLHSIIDVKRFSLFRFASVFSIVSLLLLPILLGCSEPSNDAAVSAENRKPQSSVQENVKSVANDTRSISQEKPPVDYALSFDGKDDYVEIPSLKYDGSYPLTIELTVTPQFSLEKPPNSRWGRTPSLVGDWGFSFQGYGLIILADKFHWCFGLHDEKSNHYMNAVSSDPADPNRTVHVAGVFDGKKAHLFVDGKLVGVSGRIEKYVPSGMPFLIGAAWKKGNKREFHLDGFIDELRISKTARYTKDYIPPVRFEPDGNTIALYHCDAGNGKVLKDSSSNKNDGKIVGATWVRADAIPAEIAKTNSAKPHRTLGTVSKGDPATLILFSTGNLDAFDFRTSTNATRQPTPNIFSLDDGILRAKGSETAYLITKQEFHNYHLTLEYQWISKDPSDMAGIVVNASTNTIDSPIVSGIECDLPGAESRHAIGNFSLLGRGASLRVDKKKFTTGSFARTLKNNPEKPAGEWNKLEILSDGSFQVKVNDKILLNGRWQKPNTGRIVIQLQRGEIRFRRMEVTSFETLTEEAYRLARAGKWKEAAKEFGDAFKRYPEAISTSRGLHLGMLYSATGDKEAYEKFCRVFFKKPANPLFATDSERPAKAYLISPSADNPELLKLALAAAKQATAIRSRGGIALWFQLTRGMAEYRVKNYQEARRWLVKVSRSRAAIQKTPALAFLAMTEFHRGRKRVAKRLLAQAKAANLEIEKPSANDYGKSWNDILGAQLALKEAIALIGDVTASTPPATADTESNSATGILLPARNFDAKGLFPKGTSVPIVTLFPAKNLDQFAVYSWKGLRWKPNRDPNHVFSLQDGFLRASGNKVLYLMTKRKVKNYHLVAEYKWLNTKTPRDSGIFVNATPNGRSIMALECNIMDSSVKGPPFGLWGIGPTRQLIVGGKKIMSVPIIEGADLEKPTGQWNRVEIICDRERFFFSINGRKIVSGTNPVPRSGAIMFQHHTGDIQFGRVQLVDYDALSHGDAETARRWQEKVFTEYRFRPTTKPEPKLTEREWQPIPTKNLKEWSDPGKWWKEENGTIVGESKGGANLPNIHFLTWNGSLKDNFELSADYRIIATEPRDAGLYFRVERNKMNKGNLVGYQAELDTGTQLADAQKRRGAIRFHKRGKLFGNIHDGKRTRMFKRNMNATISRNGKITTKPLAKKFVAARVFRKSPEWNNCRIQVVGDRIRLYLNGVLANELADSDIKMKSTGDAIALQFHPNRHYRYEVKDLKYRKLLK